MADDAMISRTDAAPLSAEQVSYSMVKDPQTCSTAKPFAVKDKQGKLIRCHATEADAKQHIASLGMDSAIRKRAGR